MNARGRANLFAAKGKQPMVWDITLGVFQHEVVLDAYRLDVVYSEATQHELRHAQSDDRLRRMQECMDDWYLALSRIGGEFWARVSKQSARKVDARAVDTSTLDTDGDLASNCYSITTKYPQLRDDMLYLCRSLGFAAYASPTVKGIKATGFLGTYYRLSISGDTNRIPCRIVYKQATPRQQVKNVLRTGFAIEPAGTGDSYGCTLDGDGRFLLGDFTVTHEYPLKAGQVDVGHVR